MILRPSLLLAFGLGLALAVLPLPAVLAHEPLGTPKTWCESDADKRLHEYGPGLGLFSALDIDGGLCSADGDGHAEYALGGTEIYFQGGTIGDGGSWWCHGIMPDHQGMTTVTVIDESGEPIPFLVSAEQSSIHDFCGDGEDDVHQECLGSCVIGPNMHSMDGAYRIFLLGGTRGHIVTD